VTVLQTIALGIDGWTLRAVSSPGNTRVFDRVACARYRLHVVEESTSP